MVLTAKIRILLSSSYGNMWRSILLIATVFVLVLVGAISVKSEILPNKYCPVTTSELAEEQFSVDYQGQQIYFCCSNCKRDFLANPDAFLANLKTSSAKAHDHGETEHEHGEQLAEAKVEGHIADTNPAHDHATDHGDSSSLVSFIGKFHPMVTHFPIALILSALIFSAMAFVFEIQKLDIVSIYSIYLAAVSGLVTVSLGLAAGYGASYPSFLADYLVTHRLLGIVTGVLTIVTAYFGHRQLQTKSTVNTWSYRGLLLANSVLVGITGHYGATLVFGPDHFNF